MNVSLNRISVLAALCAGFVLALSLAAPAQYREYLISGKVVDTQKNPVPDVEIRLRDEGTSRSYTFKTKKDGTFKFVGLPHGVYTAVFIKPGFAEKTDEWKFVKPQDQMVKVEIPPVVMIAAEVLAQAEKMKEAAAGVKEATEKVRSGDFDAALALLKRVLEKNPEDSNAWYVRGLALQRKGELADAAAAFLRVTELAPQFAAGFYQLGACYQRQGEPELALGQYQKALALDPANADLIYNMGLIHFGLGRIDDALPRFEQALTLKPDDPAYLEMAGRCYVNKGDFAKALAYLEKAKAAATDPERIKFLDDLIAELKARIKKIDFPGLTAAPRTA